ncbi:MAG: dihydroorotate dehydrogenase [Elusimicrobiaceae bacterium]|jgi:dihydroorotate dehydrogenase (NAD+) catalytic subunit|nr:dihydroorotate dehydrogenase [Elusimicrobiaceae bacterium]MBT3955466.1 dihydroorotate dehydrogenase [Elusimicrobiaceae bacterium]MBT4008218.1 dihydroorotate dehydrogenase [Elusimicrobiaceae bacterium]MBT4403084.1 dihydroorotate dehydrogenase [Elusimicrobiaceae bacterium]MBT4439338.1 dihydroorotate dehydrogenase [Elusimicrobiaceae bacterium]
MVNLSTKIAGIKFANPIFTASGCFGHGKTYGKFINLDKLGAVVCKTITLDARQGNKPPRIADTSGGMLNSIGLENGGVDNFIKTVVPFLKKQKTKAIVSVAGNSEREFTEAVKKLNKVKIISALEINISCPNVVHGKVKGLFSQCENETAKIIKAVKKVSKKPIIAKISPNVTDITIIAKACEKAGADAICMINTFQAMGVDIRTRKPLLGNIMGGLSGPAIKPIALKMVWEVYNTVKIPIIGVGGIMDWEDAIEFILCGASAVQIGTANFVNPTACTDILKGVEKYFKENKIKNINELKGKIKL